MRLIWPMIDHERVTSPYGPRVHPVTRQRSYHTGIDIAAPVGTSVRAAFTGTVSCCTTPIALRRLSSVTPLIS